jgi:superfamily II DNA or RNA helicase
MTTLRPYQTEAKHQINTLLNANRHPLFVSGTGSGKTITSVHIIIDQINIGNIIYITTPQIEIFDQWLKELINAGLNPGTISDKGIQGANRKVYVCMIQSLNNYLPYIPESIYPDIIVDDEAHLAAATTYRKVHAFFGNAKRYGLTGSPYRYDNKPLGDIYTDIVQTIEMKECMNKGYLAESIVIVPEKHYASI